MADDSLITTCTLIDIVDGAAAMWVCPIGCDNPKHKGMKLDEFIRYTISVRRNMLTQEAVALYMGLDVPALEELEQRDPWEWFIRELVSYVMAVVDTGPAPTVQTT